MPSPLLSAASLLIAEELLEQPFIHEDIGSRPDPIFSVGITNKLAASAADPGRLIANLRALPAVTVGVIEQPDIATSPEHGSNAVLDAFDVVLAPDGYTHTRAVTPSAVDATDVADLLNELHTTVVAHPVASTTLVQLLRASASLPIRDALVAESLAYATLQGGAEFQSWLAGHHTARAARPPAATIDEPAVIATHRSERLELALNRPHRRNAFSAAMRDELVAALRAGAIDPGVTQITVTGRGAAFCAGGDLDEFGTTPDPARGHQVRMLRSPAWWIHAADVRVVFEVHGACVGAGIELPCFGNSVFAHEDAFFRLPEVGMGLVPGAGGTVSIPRKIGHHRTAWLALTGKMISCRTALAWRLVDELVERRSNE